jgi:hypothetical protein
VNRSASHGDSRNATTLNGTETVVAIPTERRTRPRALATSSRPARIDTRRTFATSIPNRVAAAAMKAAWVVRVTTPKASSPSAFVMRTCAANVATAPIASPSTFCPVWPTITR